MTKELDVDSVLAQDDNPLLMVPDASVPLSSRPPLQVQTPTKCRNVMVRDPSIAYAGDYDHPAIVSGVELKNGVALVDATMFPRRASPKVFTCLRPIDPTDPAYEKEAGWYWPPRV